MLASKLQAMWRGKQARRLLRQMQRANFAKLVDPGTGGPIHHLININRYICTYLTLLISLNWLSLPLVLSSPVPGPLVPVSLVSLLLSLVSYLGNFFYKNKRTGRVYYSKPACLGDEDLPDPRHYHAPRDYKLPPRKLKNFCLVPRISSSFRTHTESGGCFVASFSHLRSTCGTILSIMCVLSCIQPHPLLLLQGVGNIKYANRKIPALSDAAAADFDEVKEVRI